MPIVHPRGRFFQNSWSARRSAKTVDRQMPEIRTWDGRSYDTERLPACGLVLTPKPWDAAAMFSGAGTGAADGNYLRRSSGARGETGGDDPARHSAIDPGHVKTAADA